MPSPSNFEFDFFVRYIYRIHCYRYVFYLEIEHVIVVCVTDVYWIMFHVHCSDSYYITNISV